MLVGAVKPWATRLILIWGAPVAFGLASISLLGGTVYLRLADYRSPDLTIVSEQPYQSKKSDQIESKPAINYIALLALFGIGFGLAIGFRLVMTGILPKILPLDSRESGLAFFSLAIAILSVPIAKKTIGQSNQFFLLWASLIGSICLLYLGIGQSLVSILLLSVILIPSITILFNGTIPLAISLFPQNTGLAIGIYTSGLAAANGLCNHLFPNMIPNLSVSTLAISAGLSFLAIALIVWLSRSQFQAQLQVNKKQLK
jgi:hypothetical protein